jgi:ribosomal protein S18 acetylase RimI-like enzyme
MEIRPVRLEELEAARRLLALCGWTKKVESPELFAKSVLASQIALVAEDRRRIVGFLRAITDGIFNGYISMVAVAPDYRRSGVGSALVHAAVESNSDITWVLRAERDGVYDFYRSLGFEKSSVAMEKRRR